MSDYLSRRNALLGIGTVGGSAALAVLATSTAQATGPAPTFPPGNILNFGADPTGAQDSSPAFAAAIAALWNSTTGCAIYVPTGIYKITQPIIFKTKMRLYGDGFGSIIQCYFDGATVTPSVTQGVQPALPGGALAYPPMLCNTNAIQWWSIHDLQFDGRNVSAYGAWFSSAYYGTLRNVYFYRTGQRPFTAYLSNFINLSHVAFYECNDGVLCASCCSFSLETVSFERVTGAFSFQWRAPSFAHGPLELRNLWLENNEARHNTTGYLAIGGKHIFGRCFLASDNQTALPLLRLLHLFDAGDSLSADGLAWTTIAAFGIDLGQICDHANMHYYMGAGAMGNAISGHVHLANVIGPAAAVSAGVGVSINGAISATATNTVTSLYGST